MTEQAAESVTEPLVNTIAALGDLFVAAGAGTALFAFVLTILALEFLRESKGFLIPVARTAVVGSLVFTLACWFYGDFLLQPAKAAAARFSQELPGASQSTMLLTGLGVAGAALTFYAGANSGASNALRKAKAGAAKAAIRFVSKPDANAPLRVSDLGRGLSLDVAGRLQLRALTRNPKKPPARAVKPALRTYASLQRARG
jgi:lysylphosphatidylglycerol synthetase-like protein (DUF2156 family)